MVKQTDRNADNGAGRTKGQAGAKQAMDGLGSPSGEVGLAAENAALKKEVTRLTDELRAAKAVADAANAVAAKLQEQSEALSLALAGSQKRGAAVAAPVPAVIEPLPKELEPILGREAIWSLVRPADGADSRSVVERHGVFWKRFDKVLEERGPEEAKVFLRTALQCYLDSLGGLPLEREEKQKVVARLNFMMRSLGLRAKFGDALGPIAVYGSAGTGSLRIQASRSDGSGRHRIYRSLGVNFPSLSLAVAEAPHPKVAGADRKPGRYRYL